MRLSSGLLLASASCAFGQLNQFKRFTNTSTSAVETSTSSTKFQTSSVQPTASIGTTATSVETTTSSSASVLAPIVLNLKDAILGPGASFYPPPDGDAILMSPVATDSTLKGRSDIRAVPVPVVIPSLNLPNNAIATFKQQFTSSLSAAIGINAARTLVINVTCNPGQCGGLSKRAESNPCAFEITANGEVVQIEPIPEAFGGSLEISTNPFILKLSNDYKFQQACGDIIVPIIIGGVALKDAQGASSTPIPALSIGNPTSSEAGSSTEANGAEPTTNSEGETIFPTETATNTNSQEFTTNSNGESIFPTWTGPSASSEDVATNSEGATTDSEGETLFPTGTSSGAISSASSTPTSIAGFPGDVGGFSLFGCAGSTAGFPTYTLAESSPSMDLNVCAGLCEGRARFGVHDTSCYCGDIYDSNSTVWYTLDQCDIECPGDKTQFCGGDVESKLQARQAISSNTLLTLYAKAEAAISLTESVTQTETNQETIITTLSTTVTSGESIDTKVITATLVCIDGKCHPSSPKSVAVYTFVEINGSDCDGQWVYISEPCSCAGGHQYVPHSCSDGKCASLKVYKPQQCSDWHNYESLFVPSDCTTCAQGKISYQPWEKSWGTPDNCNDQVSSCNTFECPRPHQGVSWNSTIPHGGSGGGYSPSPNGGSSGSSSSGSSSGSNGGSGGESSPGSTNGGSSGGSNGGSSSGTQGDTEGSGAPGSEGSYPSNIPFVSGAIKQACGVLSLLAGLLTLL